MKASTGVPVLERAAYHGRPSPVGGGAVPNQSGVRRRVASDHGLSGARHTAIALCWLGLGAVGLLIDLGTPDSWGQDAVLALSLLSIAFGAWVFWHHGGPRITAVGVYALASAVFVGFGCLYHVRQAAVTDPGLPFLSVAATCYFGQVLTWMIFWRRWPAPRLVPDAARADGRTAGWAVRYGCVLLALAVTISLVVPQRLPLVDSAGFVGVLLVTVGLLRGPAGRWRALSGALAGLAFVVYFLYLFNGFGRIVIGSLALALLVVMADGEHRRVMKSLVFLGAGPVLLFLAGLRATGPSSAVDQDGFGSAVSPIYSFAELVRLDAAGLLAPAWGQTFLNSAVALIPRALWPDKPVGFGADLVPLLRPDLAGTEHSSAALWQGEWLYNFGLWGLALMIPVAGLVVRAVDRLYARAASRPLTTPARLSAYVASVLAAVGMFDLVWVGSFTYVARTGGRLLVLAALVLAVGWVVRRLGDPAGGVVAGSGGDRWRVDQPQRSAGRHRSNR
ncbi:O-antigen polymerase [Micromonospora sp. WMMD1082]|uniref:O-antigen polymerase n=1 Tax=Micromonospora sp. WMMD1082 TaxID=3016104 RepID=UPI0024159B66|nr:O-antigen polymerase [Micromonospora sp. WMMD1082]MDG4798703.1 O-antigen ligase [Micromonospora sp. WMMD1082]